MKLIPILALPCLLAGCSFFEASTVHPRQTDCWPKTLVQSATVVTHGDVGTITVSLESSVGAYLISKQHFNLKDDAKAKALESSNAYLQNGSASYDIREAPLNLLAGTEVILPPGVALADGKIPAETKVIVESANFARVKLGDNSKLTPTTEFSRDDLRPEVLPSATPPGTIKARAFKIGAGFQTAKDTLDACILIDDRWQHASIEKVDATADYADLTIALPPSTQSRFHHPILAVMLGNGSYLAQGRFYAIPIWFGAFIAIAVLIVGHIFFWWLAIKDDKRGVLASLREGSIKKFPQTWFSGADGLPSLSMFQIYLWTWLVLVGLTYVVTITGELFAITPQVLTLLGIAGAGSLAARFVSTGNVQRSKSADTATFADILKTDGKFDLYRLQMFLFTAYTAVFVALRIALDQAFPALDASLLLLMGISNGIYVGSKAAGGDSPFQTAERLDLQLKILNEAKVNADREVARLNTEKAAIDAKVASSPTDESLKIEQALAATRLVQATQKADDLQKQINDTTAARKSAIDNLPK